jgi:hypothetical protein
MVPFQKVIAREGLARGPPEPVGIIKYKWWAWPRAVVDHECTKTLLLDFWELTQFLCPYVHVALVTTDDEFEKLVGLPLLA